jgi:hypothetical protein
MHVRHTLHAKRTVVLVVRAISASAAISVLFLLLCRASLIPHVLLAGPARRIKVRSRAQTRPPDESVAIDVLSTPNIGGKRKVSFSYRATRSLHFLNNKKSYIHMFQKIM